MEATIDQISAALKIMQEQLSKLSAEWDSRKGAKGEQNKMIGGLHSQVSAWETDWIN